jgi:hypothetical protein
VVLSPTCSGRERTILRRADVRSTSTSFRGKTEGRKYNLGSNRRTPTINMKGLSERIQKEKLGILTVVMSPVPVANKSQITP